MDQRHFRQLIVLCALLAVPVAVAAQAPKFYPDDPVTKEPPPFPTYVVEARALSEILELASNTVGRPGERHPEGGVIPAGGVNTLGEVPDGSWFVNRHAARRLTREALIRGPRAGLAPLEEGSWHVLTVKPYGSRPGILIRDARQQRYLLLFDDPDSPEVSTSAQVISSHILYAIGYHVPESYIVTFPREKLVLGEGAEIVSSAGNTRVLAEKDVDVFLSAVPRIGPRRFRAVAVHVSPDDATSVLGPYQMFATRSDDPNDIVPHEHRRDLRGLFVIASWLDLARVRATSTLDFVIDDGRAPPHIRHYIAELWSSLGGGDLKSPRRAWDGNDPMFDARAAVKNIVGFGVWAPAWARARYPRIRGVGQFESETFDPPRWASIERLAPFENRLPDDEFWGAKQVMAFTDDDIRALVSGGEFTDPAAAEWIARSLMARRDKIGRHYFATILPLDAFRIEKNRLAFDHLGERYGLTPGTTRYAVRWFRLVNDTGALVPVPQAESLELPAEIERAEAGSYYGVRIEAAGGDPERQVMVYVRSAASGGHRVVGIERTWPGKVLANPNRHTETGVDRFAALTAEQQQLYAPYATVDAERRGRRMTTAEHFEGQAISERTTFDAVTHALLRSHLTDPQGKALGRAFDLVATLDRIAGQYYGRSGDQQFRVYVTLKPGAVDTLERAVEFFRGSENTVYHVGYPQDFRQTGRVPNVQFSISEDGLRADIDVDYRSSRLPRALFNGHLSAANSDVRAGDNVARHNARWTGMIPWWRAIFGKLPDGQEGPRDALAEAASTDVPTPLPPDRRPGSPIDRVEDAVQEFLTDWLVRREIDEALTSLSDHASACLNVDDDAEYEALDAHRTRSSLQETMRYAVSEIETPLDLTEALDAVPFLNPDRQRIAHAFDREFSMTELSLEEASHYLCKQQQGLPADRTYYGVLFRFTHSDGGALGLLWTKEADDWKLVSFHVFGI
jgi:hypothetical protein